MMEPAAICNVDVPDVCVPPIVLLDEKMVTRCSAKLGVAFLKKADGTCAPNK